MAMATPEGCRLNMAPPPSGKTNLQGRHILSATWLAMNSGRLSAEIIVEKLIQMPMNTDLCLFVINTNAIGCIFQVRTCVQVY